MENEDPDHEHSARFPTTVWTLVDHAKNPLSDAHLQAISVLASKYWKPVYYFIRAKGYVPDRAEDLTQAFFLSFLERDWIRRADRERGRFRSFLLAILVRFLSDRGPYRGRQQNRFEQKVLSISALLTDRDRAFEPARGESPEEIFMRRWAVGLVEHVRRQVEQEMEAQGQTFRYRLFEAARLAEPGSEVSQVALAKEHGLSRDQVRYALEQVREALCRAFRHELRLDGCSPVEVEAELAELLRLVGG
jgi:DNA-directed RNA polymerase specialized sigma24 family protein